MGGMMGALGFAGTLGGLPPMLPPGLQSGWPTAPTGLPAAPQMPTPSPSMLQPATEPQQPGIAGLSLPVAAPVAPLPQLQDYERSMQQEPQQHHMPELTQLEPPKPIPTEERASENDEQYLRRKLQNEEQALA